MKKKKNKPNIVLWSNKKKSSIRCWYFIATWTHRIEERKETANTRQEHMISECIYVSVTMKRKKKKKHTSERLELEKTPTKWWN